MRLLPTAIAAATVTLLTVPSAFAMEKMDGDAWLKMIFHGKPGEMMHMAMPAMPTMPKGKMDMGKMGHMAMPWKWPMATK
jgi:hypothetical protein